LYQRDKLSFELKFNYAKELFIKFILEKKRNNKEIDVWLKDYDKEISERLERMTSRKFTTDELEETKIAIAQLIKDLKEKEIELKESQKHFDKYPDPTIARGISSKKNTVNLFEVDDISENKEGIIIWDGNDIFDKIDNKTDENVSEEE
jgi:seryl-tRNA synthetase